MHAAQRRPSDLVKLACVPARGAHGATVDGAVQVAPCGRFEVQGRHLHQEGRRAWWVQPGAALQSADLRLAHYLPVP